jgi:hypothetical protein
MKEKMIKIVALLGMAISMAGCVFMCAGCQTRITAEKFAESAHPIQAVVQTNGIDVVITTGYMVTSGGWYATARSPLYADEIMKGLDLGVMTNGTVYLRLDSYHRDLSTNAVVMTKTIFDGSSNLALAVAKAYATIQTGGATDASSALVSKVVNYFKSRGGDASKSTVSAENGKITVTDGSTCISCDEAGNCTDCSPKQ